MYTITGYSALAKDGEESVTRESKVAAVKALAAKGIRIVGLQAIPDMSSDMPFANAERGYVVDDNGTQRVWPHIRVVAEAHCV